MIVELPTLERLEALGPERAAAFWLERLDHEAPEAAETLFRTWLSASDANQAAWNRALDLWDSFDSDDLPPELQQMRQDALALRPGRLTPGWIPYAAAASASLVIAAASAITLLNLGPRGPTLGPEIATAERPNPARLGGVDYATAVGQRRTITLADGSQVTLDTDTAVDVGLGADKRLVRLVRGQAYFEVAHDVTRPFRVAAGDRVVSVLGTRFNIRLMSDETRILLVEGSVGVSKGSDPERPQAESARLSPGQELIAHAGRADEVTTPPTAPQLEWKRGFVQFDSQTLAAAVEELNRYSTRKLVVRDPAVARLRISGAFPTGDVDGFVQTLLALYPVQVKTLPDGRLELVPRR